MNKSEIIFSLEKQYKLNLDEIEEKKLKYISSDRSMIIALAYYFKIIETTKAIIILLKEGNLQSAIMPVLRTSLEAIIDLDNILNIEGYIEYLEYLNISNLRYLSKKKYIEDITDDFEGKQERIQKKKQSLEEIINRKYKIFVKNKKGKMVINTSIWFKFDISQNRDAYDTLYWILCADAHNNISNLEEYYIEEKVAINTTVTHINKANEVERICKTLEIILVYSKEMIHKILNKENN